MSKRISKTIIAVVVRLAISVGLLGFLLLQIDIEVFVDLAKRFPIHFFAPLTALFIGTMFLGSWRWKVVLGCLSLNQSILRGFYLYLVGYFYNNFFPTAIGGDVVRGYEAGKSLGSMSKVYTSVLVERAMGLLATLTLALGSLLMAPVPQSLMLLVVVLNIGAWGFIAFVLFVKESTSYHIIRKAIQYLPDSIEEKIKRIVKALEIYRQDRVALGKGFLISLLYQGSLVFVVWIVAIMLDVGTIPLQAYFVFVPLIWILSLVPISLNALGVREVSFAYFFQLLGSTEEEGFLVSLIFFGTTLIAGAIGGVAWGLLGHWINRREKGAAETTREDA